MPDFLPLRENELVSWTANFAQKLEDLGAEFGIPPAGRSSGDQLDPTSY